MLDQKTKDRIAKDTRTASDVRYEGEAQNFEYIEFEDGYKAGAEKEAERAQGLVSALEEVKKKCMACGWRKEVRDSVINDILSGVEKTLTKYNNSK